MTELSLDQSARLPETVLIQKLPGGEAVLLDLETDKYYGLDATGARILRAITTEPTLAAAVDACLEEYDVDRERLEGDLRTLARRLIDQGLLHVQRP